MAGDLSRRKFMRTVGTATTLFGTSAPTAANQTGREPGGNKKLIIDSHVHLKHGDVKRTEFPAQVIIAIMDKAGIDRAIVFAMCTTTKRSISMAELAAKTYPDRLIPFAYALPHYERPVIKELEAALASRLFRGIKIHAGECTLPDYIIDPVLRLAGRCNVPCLIDVAGNIATAQRMAEAFPDNILIFAHMGRYQARDTKLVDAFIKLAGDHKKVLLDLSGVELVSKIGEAVGRIGAAKLIWGTDGPYANPDLFSFAQNELEKVQRLSISREDKDKILGGNIARLINLES